MIHSWMEGYPLLIRSSKGGPMQSRASDIQKWNNMKYKG
jgi:hypothetical protein